MIKKVTSLLFGLFVTFSVLPSLTQASEQMPDYPDYAFGKNGAPVQMEVFFDFQDRFSSQFFHTLFSERIKGLVDEGNLQIHLRDFPLSFYQNAFAAAQAANAVQRLDERAFLGYLFTLFESQDQWGETKDPFGIFTNFATALKIDSAAFKKYFFDEANVSEIKNDIREGEKRGISGTPTYFINGVQYVGAYDEKTLLEQLERALSTKNPLAGFEDEVRVRFTPEENPFSDTDITTLEGKAAAELFYRGVIGGFPDGEFKGDRPVNRAEAAKFLLLAKGVKVPEFPGKNPFPDVIEGEWYARFVIQAALLNILFGYSDGTVRPANAVTVAEFLAMMARTFNLEKGLPHDYQDLSKYPGAWFWDYAGIAQKYDLFPYSREFLNPEKSLTRYEVGVAIYQYLRNRGL